MRFRRNFVVDHALCMLLFYMSMLHEAMNSAFQLSLATDHIAYLRKLWHLTRMCINKREMPYIDLWRTVLIVLTYGM